MSEFYVRESGIKLRQPGRLYIDGKWLVVPPDQALELISPSDEECYARVACAKPREIELAVEAARRAFDEGPWPRMTAAERSDAVRRFGALLLRRGPELARCWSLQAGVPATIATYAFTAPQALYDYYANLVCESPSSTRESRQQDGFAIVVREPVGVVAAVAPWNHPFHLMSLKVAPALCVGCTVVAKPAPESPLDALIMAECAEEAGLPPGVFNVVPAERDASDHLVRHPGIDKVSFTGSSAAGSHIASVCGARMARSSMELGGKSAAIVLDDIAIKDVMPSLIQAGGIRMAGQGCAFLTRVLVSRARQEQLVEAYAAAMRAIKVGHALDPMTEMGPIAMKRQRDRVEGYIAKGIAEGARLVTGGKRPPHLPKGYFIEPTVFADVGNQMAIAREEIFGPVISVITYDSESDAVRIANDTAYGLNGAVYTNDVEKAYAIARRVRAGNFTHNGLQYDTRFPFGGFKMSGIGREGGPQALDLYTELKTIYMARIPVELGA